MSIEDGVAVVETPSHRMQRVILICLEGDLPTPGDWLLVQSGIALARLSEEQVDEYPL